MTRPVPLTTEERATLVSSPMTRDELAEIFQCSVATIKRARHRIRSGCAEVYLIQPPVPERKKPGRPKKGDMAVRMEAFENPLGVSITNACEDHLADLKRCHEPLVSLQIASRFHPWRWHAP